MKTGELVKIYTFEHELRFGDGTRISTDDIVDIQSTVFENKEEWM